MARPENASTGPTHTWSGLLLFYRGCPPIPGSDAGQIAFETYAIVLGSHHDLRLFQAEDVIARAERAFAALLQRHLP